MFIPVPSVLLRKFCQNLLKSNWTPFNQEVFIVMYSVTETKSFEVAQKVLRAVSALSPDKDVKDNDRTPAQQDSFANNPGPTPLVYFVGNKTDLDHIR